jgi:hypothetical protein
MKKSGNISKDSYQKMAKRVVRDFNRIPEPGYPNSSKEDVWDAYLHFFSDAYHLKDHILNDKTLNISQSDIDSFINNNKDIKLLQSLVTGFKHLKADHDHISYDVKGLEWDDGSPKPSPEIDYEERNFLLTEDGKYLLCENGKKIRLESDIEKMHPRDLAVKVLATWNEFFKEKNIETGFVIQ